MDETMRGTSNSVPQSTDVWGSQRERCGVRSKPKASRKHRWRIQYSFKRFWGTLGCKITQQEDRWIDRTGVGLPSVGGLCCVAVDDTDDLCENWNLNGTV